MVDLYVGNATKQQFQFIYRLPENPTPRMVLIPIGAQTCIRDLRTLDVDAILAQHQRYGLRETSSIDRTREFVGYCYSLDKPITSLQLQRALEHNDGVLVERGKEQRKLAAVASHNALEQNLAESSIPGNLIQVEASIVEENHDDRSQTPAIAEGLRVRRDDTAEPARRPHGNSLAGRRRRREQRPDI